MIPKGSIFYISSGEYSDYFIQGVFQAIEDIYPEQLLKEFRQEHPVQYWPTGRIKNQEYEFMGWIYKKGLMKDLESYEFRLVDSGYQSVAREWASVNKIEGNKFSNDD